MVYLLGENTSLANLGVNHLWNETVQTTTTGMKINHLTFSSIHFPHPLVDIRGQFNSNHTTSPNILISILFNLYPTPDPSFADLLRFSLLAQPKYLQCQHSSTTCQKVVVLYPEAGASEVYSHHYQIPLYSSYA